MSNAIAAEVRSMAQAASRIARELGEYADALDADDTLEARLGDTFAGAPTVTQIMAEVANRTRQPSDDGFKRALFNAFADAQRINAAT